MKLIVQNKIKTMHIFFPLAFSFFGSWWALAHLRKWGNVSIVSQLKRKVRQKKSHKKHTKV